MIHAVNNNQIRTPFSEGVGQTGCLQKLRNLVTKIQDAIGRFFRYVLSCFSRKKAEQPLTPQRVSPNPVSPAVIAAPALQLQQRPAAPPPALPNIQAIQHPPVQQQLLQLVQPPIQQQQPVDPQPAANLIAQEVNENINAPQPPVIQDIQPAAQPPALPNIQAIQHPPVQQQLLQPVEPLVQQQQPVDPQPVVIHIANDDHGNVNAQPMGGVNNRLMRTLRILRGGNVNDLAANEVKNNNYAAAKKNEERKDNDGVPKVTSELTRKVREEWGMTALDLDVYLNQGVSSKDHVCGAKFLTPVQRKAAVYVVLEAFDLLWPVVEEGTELNGDALDTIFSRGLTKCNDDGSPESAAFQLEEILRKDYQSLVKARIGRRNSGAAISFSQGFPSDQIIQILINNARNKASIKNEDKDLFASILVAKEPVNNPPVYGLFIKSNKIGDRRYNSELYIVDPNGGGAMPICFHKFGSPASLQTLLANKSGYSCIAIENVEV